MKNAFLIIVGSLLCYNITFGQCLPLEVSTNPANPFNSEVDSNIQNSPHLNYFDWQTENYNPGNYGVSPQILTINAPFYNISNSRIYNKLNTDLGVKDYYIEDGWELLNENITKINRTDIIYFTLYNKYSSTIRVLFAIDQSSNSFQSVSVELYFRDSNINAMFHPMGNIGQPLDTRSTAAVIVPVLKASNSFHFMVADFPVEYDPCVCFKDNLSSITASFELVKEEEINWIGNISLDNAIINLVADAGNTGAGEFLLAGTSITNDDNITTGAMVFKNIDELLRKYENLQAGTINYDKKVENLQKAKTALSVIATANTITGMRIGSGNTVIANPTSDATDAAAALTNDNKPTFKAIKTTADIANGLSPLTSFFNYQPKAEKSSITQEINKFGNASINFGTLNLDRNITIRQRQSTGFSMVIPGGLSTTPFINSAFYPKYDNTLGRIAVLKTPKVKIGNDEVELVEGKRLYNKRIAFDATTFEYLFNPAAGVNEAETVIFAALEVVGSKSKYLTLSEEKSYNINLDNLEATEEKVVFSSEFMPLNCLSDLSMELAYFGDVIIADDSDITITEVNIKLVISYTFDQIGRSGTKNRAVQIVTYPTEIKSTTFDEIQAPISNNGVPIPTVLELNTKQHFTTNTTLFAWEKVVINADLTTAAGVNVKIIAPEIVVANVTIDANIDLQQDFYPKECLPLETVSPTKVANFCNSSAYNADKPKILNQTGNTPVFERPTRPIDFQAYPNPFGNTFSIVFELETEAETSLVIYDALGRVVETVLMNDILPLGKYRYQINAANFEGGLYYATLKNSSGTQTIKLMKQ